eukprot:gene39348-48621_t
MSAKKICLRKLMAVKELEWLYFLILSTLPSQKPKYLD